jgi:hypothetical protein
MGRRHLYLLSQPFAGRDLICSERRQRQDGGHGGHAGPSESEGGCKGGVGAAASPRETMLVNPEVVAKASCRR